MIASSEPKDGYCILSVKLKTMDISNVHDFKETVEQYLNDKHVILDMQDVQFIDSSGLGAILGLSRRLNELSLSFSVSHVNPRVMQLFEMVRVNRVVNIYDNTDDALTDSEGVTTEQ